MIALAFLKEHWRPALVAALLIAAFSGGYAARRPTIVTKVVTQTVTVTKEVKGETREVVRNQVVYRDRVVHPDGTVEEKSETRTVSDATDKKTDVVDAKTDTKSTSASSVATSPRPDWHFGLLVGTPVLAPKLLLGVQVERRILGPFYVGAWALNPTDKVAPIAGASLGVAW